MIIAYLILSVLSEVCYVFILLLNFRAKVLRGVDDVASCLLRYIPNNAISYRKSTNLPHGDLLIHNTFERWPHQGEGGS